MQPSAASFSQSDLYGGRFYPTSFHKYLWTQTSEQSHSKTRGQLRTLSLCPNPLLLALKQWSFTRQQNSVLRLRKYIPLLNRVRLMMKDLCCQGRVEGEKRKKKKLQKPASQLHEKQFQQQQALCFLGQRSIKSLLFTHPV